MHRPLGKSTVCALMVLVSLVGCDREWSVLPKSGEVSSRDTPVVPGGESGASLQEPSAAIAQWRQWRDSKKYRLLRRHIDPDDRAVFLDTLVGADLVLDANQQACQAIAGVMGEHRIELWDLSSLGGDLGLFSNDLTVIQVERNGNQATVTFQVGERLPLETAELRLGPQGCFRACCGTWPRRFRILPRWCGAIAPTWPASTRNTDCGSFRGFWLYNESPAR